MAKIRFVVIGLGGYGLAHIDAVRWLSRQGLAQLTGVVALEPDRKRRPDLAAELEREGVTLYESVDAFFERGARTADVLTVPIGIHQHVPVAVRALEAGLHVYCEKPIAATVQDVDRLIDAQSRTDRKVAIGYQHLSSVSIQKLKATVAEGRLGNLRSIALWCSWPRSVQYYTRNNWAGKLRVGDDWILDSPANNAHAHYVINALYLASPDAHAASSPVTVKAELWRAHRIESADTVQAHMTTADGVRVDIFVTHAGPTPIGPIMHIVGDLGRAYWLGDEGRTTVLTGNGNQEVYDNRSHALWRFDAIRYFVASLHDAATFICTPEIARAQTLAINLMHESCRSICAVPDPFVAELEDCEMHPPGVKGLFRRIVDLDPAMHVAFHEGLFLSELALPWTAGMTSEVVRGEGYVRFPAIDP